MAKYEVTFQCGHVGIIDVWGKTKEREWRIRNAKFNLCPECLEKERTEQREKAQKEANLLGLPELKGSEKQVNWALTLRKDFIKEFNAFIEEYKKEKQSFKVAIHYIDPDVDTNIDYIPDIDAAEAFKQIRDYILLNKTYAKHYIEHRHNPEGHIVAVWREVFKSNKIKEEEQLLAQIKAEATVIPEDKITDSVAEINVYKDKITTIFKKDSDFIDLVKSLGYQWSWNDRVWYRNINILTGSAEDRAAELGNKLLNAGYPIMIMEPEIREKAIKGKFETEKTRQIIKGKEPNTLRIWWRGYDTDLYDAAKSLPGARWKNPFIYVDIEHYTEIEEFADLYEFYIHAEAKELIESYIQALESVQVVTPKKVTEEKTEEKTSKLDEILESSDEILPDLLDD